MSSLDTNDFEVQRPEGSIVIKLGLLKCFFKKKDNKPFTVQHKWEKIVQRREIINLNTEGEK